MPVSMPLWTPHVGAIGLCLSVMQAPMAMAQGVSLPSGFDGDYVPDGAPCTPEQAISVRDGRMIGPEFAITVTDLIEHPTDPLSVEATLLNEAGGGEWTDGATLILSEDGQELTFVYPEGGEVAWLRCPRQY